MTGGVHYCSFIQMQKNDKSNEHIVSVCIVMKASYQKQIQVYFNKKKLKVPSSDVQYVVSCHTDPIYQCVSITGYDLVGSFNDYIRPTYNL